MSSIPEDWATGEDAGEDFYEPNTADTDYRDAIVPVRVVFDETKLLPPEFASFMTWSLQQTGVTGGGPVQILQRRLNRYKARFLVTFPGAGSMYYNSKPDPLQAAPNSTPQGFTLTVTAAGVYALPDYEAMPALYAVASIAGVTISVMDETYGQVQSR